MSEKQSKLPIPRRNAPCPCGSGRKYGYCCIAKVRKRRVVQADVECPHCHVPLEVDLSDTVGNFLASALLPVKNFCKDHDLYFFQGFGDQGANLLVLLVWHQALADGSLTKDAITNFYRANLNQDVALSLIDDATVWSNSFAERKRILVDATHAHFEERYTLSAPVFFIRIEGLLRDFGDLELSEKFMPCIPVKTWNRRFLFWVTDDAERFNAFVSRLFEGQLGHNEFGRNPVLHGTNVGYANADSSLLLFLVVLEIRHFLLIHRETREFVWHPIRPQTEFSE